MRILTRSEFLAEPVGTVFQVCSPHGNPPEYQNNQICRKGATDGTAFAYIRCGYHVSHLTTGTSYALARYECRAEPGPTDEVESRYVVYDAVDVAELLRLINEGLASDAPERTGTRDASGPIASVFNDQLAGSD